MYVSQNIPKLVRMSQTLQKVSQNIPIKTSPWGENQLNILR